MQVVVDQDEIPPWIADIRPPTRVVIPVADPVDPPRPYFSQADLAAIEAQLDAMNAEREKRNKEKIITSLDDFYSLEKILFQDEKPFSSLIDIFDFSKQNIKENTTSLYEIIRPQYLSQEIIRYPQNNPLHLSPMLLGVR